MRAVAYDAQISAPGASDWDRSIVLDGRIVAFAGGKPIRRAGQLVADEQ